jgi:hypothetical protein
MAFSTRERTQRIRIPCRLIDETFGRDSSDNAGDFMVDTLRELSDFPSQYVYRFRADLTHANPWFHVLGFIIEDIPEGTYRQLVARFAAHGITPE